MFTQPATESRLSEPTKSVYRCLLMKVPSLWSFPRPFRAPALQNAVHDLLGVRRARTTNKFGDFREVGERGGIGDQEPRREKWYIQV